MLPANQLILKVFRPKYPPQGEGGWGGEEKMNV
jgi:hypothetical protein